MRWIPYHTSNLTSLFEIPFLFLYSSSILPMSHSHPKNNRSRRLCKRCSLQGLKIERVEEQRLSPWLYVSLSTLDLPCRFIKLNRKEPSRRSQTLTMVSKVATSACKCRHNHFHCLYAIRYPHTFLLITYLNSFNRFFNKNVNSIRGTNSSS